MAERFLPGDVGRMIEDYQNANKAGVKFIQLLARIDQIYVWHFQIKMGGLRKWIEDHHLPVVVVETTYTCNGSLRIIGELPLIHDNDLKELVLIMAKDNFQLSMLNRLLQESESSLRIIELAKDYTGKGFSIYDAGSSSCKAKFFEEFGVIEIKM